MSNQVDLQKYCNSGNQQLKRFRCNETFSRFNISQYFVSNKRNFARTDFLFPVDKLQPNTFPLAPNKLIKCIRYAAGWNNAIKNDHYDQKYLLMTNNENDDDQDLND